MTSYSSPNGTRFYSSLEEAKAAGQPAGKKDWEIYCISGTAANGERVTVYGWTGGAAVLGWQCAVALGGWSATKAETARKVDPAAVMASASEEEREALMAKYFPDLFRKLQAEKAKGQRKPAAPGQAAQS